MIMYKNTWCSVRALDPNNRIWHIVEKWTCQFWEYQQIDTYGKLDFLAGSEIYIYMIDFLARNLYSYGFWKFIFILTEHRGIKCIMFISLREKQRK